jgi:hypothetical protein
MSPATMALPIRTFSNQTGGDAFFKAIGHPLALDAARALVARLAAAGPVAIYDHGGGATAFAALHDVGEIELAGVYVQDVARIGECVLGRAAQPVTELASGGARALFLPAFDGGRTLAHVGHLLPAGAAVETLDPLKLPAAMLTNPARYLDPLNFATNLALFRDEGGVRTRVVTANYWAGYGATGVRLWCRLFAADGSTLATWEQALPDAMAGVVIDSAEIRARFGLGDFAGTLFLHALRAKGHDVIKYALDVVGATPGDLTCTHDANAWPADLYAGLPAPGERERVVLWLQNAHPVPAPAGAIRIGLMGRSEKAPLATILPGFGTTAIDVGALLPDARWPQQLEIEAGRHVVRPRYEILSRSGAVRRRMAHANVERTDLRPDPRIPELANLLGKGYLLPAPVLPRARFASLLLPTPMATTQAELPVRLMVYGADGRLAAQRFLGRLPRDHDGAWDVDTIVDGAPLAGGYGHMELVYDFRDGGGADGWLHALFRYEDRESGHTAETSFGAHVFNAVLTYRGEPQSYAGPPPGLSTRLFLRVAEPPHETLCHLIYPASTPWHAASATELALHAANGTELARRRVAIACSGSLLWSVGEMFGAETVARAGRGGYVLVRDLTCRLFGYHGIVDPRGGFSFDHMFGF